jgi:hypothetical protein
LPGIRALSKQGIEAQASGKDLRLGPVKAPKKRRMFQKFLFTSEDLSPTNSRMKKYLCILVSVGLLAACEQRTQTVTPSESPGATPASETTTTSSAMSESPATESSPSPTP